MSKQAPPTLSNSYEQALRSLMREVSLDEACSLLKHDIELRSRIVELLGDDVGSRFEQSMRWAPPSQAVLAVRHKGELVTAKMRDTLLESVRNGEQVEIEFTAITFRQKPGVHNKNYMRIADKARTLKSAAKSGSGTPFLLDHAQRSVAARMGTVLGSKGVRNDADNEEFLFTQDIRAVKPFAVEGVLDGTIDRFSIGWVATGPVNCSQCGTEVFSDCFHIPGEVCSLDDGSEVVIEWVFTAVELVEVSAVNVPAVAGTGIEEVRAALAAHSKTTVPVVNKHERTQQVDIEKLREIFGLPESATEAEVLAAARSNAADAAQFQDTKGRLEAIEKQRQLEVAQQQALQVEERIRRLKVEGKLSARPGRVEELLRGMAEDNFEAFEAYCDQMPVVVPVAQQQTQTETEVNNPEPVELSDAAVNVANPHLPGILAQLSSTGLKVGMDDVKRHHASGKIRPMGESLLGDRKAYEGGN